MNLSQSPSQHLLHQLALTPEMRQSLRILQMPLAELDAYLAAQVTENCALEMADPSDNEHETVLDQPDETASFPENPELLWVNDFTPANDSSGYERFPGENPGYEDFNGEDYCGATAPSLQDHLMAQLHLADLSPVQLRIGEFLLGNIDADGFLRCPPAEAAALLRVQTAAVSEMIRLIQTFDPSGVCCRDLAECLALQWAAGRQQWEKAAGPELYQVTAQIIAQHLAVVAAGKLAQIAAQIKKPLATVRKAADLIKRLDPKPARNFGALAATPYLLPDIVVTKYGAEYQITIENSYANRLYINPLYHRLLNNPAVERETGQYIKERIQAARCLFKCLAQRKNTLLKIAAAVVRREKDFLEKGPLHVTPLGLQDIAAAVAMHESTVSRAIQGKSIATPQGLFSLKFFFHRKLNAAPGEVISAETVKRTIADLIRAENKQVPHSDQQLAALLKARGIDASRRTVAKYREALAIPASPQRRCPRG